MKKTNIKKLAIVATMAALSALLMFMEFGIPIFPGFLKFDASGLFAVLTGFIFSPIYGVAVVIIKNLIHLLFTKTFGVGELADILILSSFVLSSGYIYRLRRTMTAAVISLVVGIAVMTVAGAVVNMFILIPFYSTVMNIPVSAIINMCKAINPNVNSLFDCVLFLIAPFNLVKGTGLAILSFLIYKRLAVVLRKFIYNH